MTIAVTAPNGATVNFPEGTDGATIDKVMRENFAAPSVSTNDDMAKTAVPSLIRGAAGLLTAPMAFNDMMKAGAGVIAENTVGRAISGYKSGGRDWSIPPQENVVPTLLDSLPSLPRQGDVVSAIEKNVTGPLYHPQTTGGKYVNTIGEFLPAAMLGPGNAISKAIKFGVIPGAASEFAGQKTEGTPFEPYARAGGAVAGGIVGALSGQALQGIGNVVHAREAAQGIGSELGTQTPSAGAVRRLAESMKADDITPASIAARRSALGDDAMLMDMGRQLGGRAEAIATQPGRGQNTVLNAVEGRTGTFGDATAARVKDTLDRTMGASPNVVDLTKRVESIVDSYARPAYKEVMSKHPVVWDEGLKTLAERPAIAEAMKDAVSLAKNYGETISGAKPSLQFWDYVKKGLDARINGMMKTGGVAELGGQQKADLGGLMDAKRALVQHLDGVTEGAYANARKLSATKFELREAADIGRGAFNTKLLPEEFAAQLEGMSLPEKAMAQAHFRREIDRVIDSARNDGAAARRLLDTNNNRQKIEAVFGPNAGTEIERRIGAETHFQKTTNDIAGNSRTAVRQELRKDTETPSTNQAFSTSLTGVAHAAGRGGLNYMRSQGMSRTRDDMAGILTAKGDNIDKVAEFIAEFNRRKLAGKPSGAALSSSALNAFITSQQSR